MKIKTIIITFTLLLLNSVIYPATNEFYDTSILRTLKLEFAQSNWWQQLEANAKSNQNILATLIYEDEIFDSVGVRFRGMTSYMMTRNSKKKPFNIELDWKKDQKLMGYEELNLINCNNDPTFMREVLFSNTCREVLPSSMSNFVKLEINSENWGIYANVQQLDGTFIRDWFPSNDGTRWRGGIMSLGGWPGGGGFNGGAALKYLGIDTTEYAKVYEIKNTRQDNPWESLIHTCDVLNNTPLEQLPVELPKLLDVDRSLWLCAFEILFNDNDGYIFKRGSDYYLYYEPESGRIHLIQYDANECLKTERMPGNLNEQWSPFFRSDDSRVPIMYRLMRIPEYRQRYLAHIRSILSNYLNANYLFTKIDAYRELIESEVRQDNKKLYSNQQFDSGIKELKNFVQSRITDLLSNTEVNHPIPEILSVNKNISDDVSGQKLSITAYVGSAVPVKQVNIFLSESNYGQFTSQAMFDDGLHSDSGANDNIYGIELPVYPPGTVLRYYIQAIANDDVGTMNFEPFAEHLAYKYVVTFPQADNPSIIINELMAQNNTSIADPQGDYDDWIELKNITTETVDLSGMYLSDKLDNPLKWKFPDSTTIEPGGYLIIWADENGNAEIGLHANFKLSAHGETILLIDSDEKGNALLDSVTFGTQNTDQSFGRYPDASTEWQILSYPTPGSRNEFFSSVTDNALVPQEFQVWPAFPNPFNSTTTISFSIPAKQKVTLIIFDALGRKVLTLVDDILPAGYHSVKWQAENMASGVYLYQFRSNSFTMTKKVILMK